VSALLLAVEIEPRVVGKLHREAPRGEEAAGGEVEAGKGLVHRHGLRLEREDQVARVEAGVGLHDMREHAIAHDLVHGLPVSRA
jgi:hypothetical protein